MSKTNYASRPLKPTFADVTIVPGRSSHIHPLYRCERVKYCIMAETQDQWYHRQAVERLAQHIPFEQDKASKAEQIEMLRGLVIRHGREMDPELFGFEARTELQRLGLWHRIGSGT